jgi:hypothetical protein
MPVYSTFKKTYLWKEINLPHMAAMHLSLVQLASQSVGQHRLVPDGQRQDAVGNSVQSDFLSNRSDEKFGKPVAFSEFEM